MSIKDENDLMHFMLDKIAMTFVSYFRSLFQSSVPRQNFPYSRRRPNILYSGQARDLGYSKGHEKECITRS